MAVIVLPMWLATLLTFHFSLMLIFISLYFLLTRNPARLRTSYGVFGPKAMLTVGLIGTLLTLALLWFFEMFDFWWIMLTTLQLILSSILLAVAVVKTHFKQEN